MADIDGRLAKFVRDNEPVIVSALEVYAESMRETAGSTEAVAALGQGTSGLWHAAQMFTSAAEQASRVSRELQELTEEE
jgi:hypothetical protein